MKIYDSSQNIDNNLKSQTLNQASDERLGETTYLTDAKIQGLFQEFKGKFDKTYKNDAGEAQRFNIFRENLIYITKHNQQPNIDFTMEVNEFADLSQSEFNSDRLGYTSHLKSEGAIKFLDAEKVEKKPLPKSIDWSESGAVTVVKNQRNCGSCYAFSANGALEGRYKIATGQLVNFSEQQIVDCSSGQGNMGCNGGLMGFSFSYVQENGLCSDEGYPYEASENACRAEECTPVIKPHDLLGYQRIFPNSTQLLMQALSSGPVSVAIQANQMAFQFYKDGVLTAACGNRLDHGVLAVGYGTLDGKDYWKVKNSWGEGWGNEGYILMERGKDDEEGGKCGILMQTSYPVFNPSISLNNGMALPRSAHDFRLLGSNDMQLNGPTGKTGEITGSLAAPIILGAVLTIWTVKKIFGCVRRRAHQD
ncbi:MAG: C1A family cysteine protease [Chlamydiales bacterium]|jgi:C1A family cysteine protease